MGLPVTVTNFDAMTNPLQKQIDYQIEKNKQNHEAWSKSFLEAEKKRRDEEAQWRDFYAQVYQEENSTLKMLVTFALTGIQLWALYTQYKQQKEIAKRTYELANRQLRIAEELFSYYKAQYQPHEVKLGEKINEYFANPYRQQYDVTAGRFATNARIAMAGKRKEILMCASQYCTGATSTALKDIALQTARVVSNAMNSAVKYENLREQKFTEKWLNARLTMIANGRGVQMQAVGGLDGALKAFSSFGADPGAALSKLLTTVAHTVGGIIPAPDNIERGNSVTTAGSPYARAAYRAVVYSDGTTRGY